MYIYTLCKYIHVVYIYVYTEKLHTVVSTHLLYVGSNCCKAQGLDESVEDRLSLNTAPQFGTLVVPHLHQRLLTKEVVSTIMLSLPLLV